MDSVIIFLVGGAVGVVGRLLSERFRAYRFVLRLMRPLRDKVAVEDRVVEELERDPFFAREYARPAPERRPPSDDVHSAVAT